VLKAVIQASLFFAQIKTIKGKVRPSAELQIVKLIDPAAAQKMKYVTKL
jgi:hypothetical protein